MGQEGSLSGRILRDDEYCQYCGGEHQAPREAAASIAIGYPLTVCFVNRVLDDFEGNRERTIAWLDAWASMGSAYYVTPSYYKANFVTS